MNKSFISVRDEFLLKSFIKVPLSDELKFRFHAYFLPISPKLETPSSLQNIRMQVCLGGGGRVLSDFRIFGVHVDLGIMERYLMYLCFQTVS